MLALGSTWTAYALNGAVGLCQPGAACASRPAVARMVMTPAAGKAEEQLVQQWVPPVPWEVHKFGGASLATADLYKECSDLLVDESRKGLARDGSWAPTMVIVSAKGGVTDKLIAVVNAARSDMAESARLLRIVADEQVEVVRAIADADVAAEVEARIRADEEDILMVVRAVSLIKTVELVTGYGEVWSAQTMHAYLQSAGVPSAWLDAREVLVVEQTGGAAGWKRPSVLPEGSAPIGPTWWLQGLRPLPRTPERRLSSLEARGGPSSPPQAAPRTRVSASRHRQAARRGWATRARPTSWGRTRCGRRRRSGSRRGGRARSTHRCSRWTSSRRRRWWW
jgi:hypothetical protein